MIAVVTVNEQVNDTKLTIAQQPEHDRLYFWARAAFDSNTSSEWSATQAFRTHQCRRRARRSVALASIAGNTSTANGFVVFLSAARSRRAAPWKPVASTYSPVGFRVPGRTTSVSCTATDALARTASCTFNDGDVGRYATTTAATRRATPHGNRNLGSLLLAIVECERLEVWVHELERHPDFVFLSEGRNKMSRCRSTRTSAADLTGSEKKTGGASQRLLPQDIICSARSGQRTSCPMPKARRSSTGGGLNTVPNIRVDTCIFSIIRVVIAGAVTWSTTWWRPFRRSASRLATPVHPSVGRKTNGKYESPKLLALNGLTAVAGRDSIGTASASFWPLLGQCLGGLPLHVQRLHAFDISRRPRLPFLRRSRTRRLEVQADSPDRAHLPLHLRLRCRCEMCSNWQRGDRKSDMTLEQLEPVVAPVLGRTSRSRTSPAASRPRATTWSRSPR